MAGNVSLRAFTLDLTVLQVDRKRDVRDAAIEQRRPAGEVRHVLDVRRSHDAHAVFRDVHEDLVELDILLRVRPDQVVVGHSGDCEHRLPVELRIVQTVQQVDAAGSGGGDTDAEAAREFGIPACHECGSFFVPHLNEAHGIALLPERLHDPVDAVTWQAKDCVDAPFLKNVDENVCCRLSHVFSWISPLCGSQQEFWPRWF